MKFRYIGTSEEMQVYGYDFRDGKTPDVTDPNAINRLFGSTVFERVDEVKDGEDAETPAKKKPGRKPKAD